MGKKRGYVGLLPEPRYRLEMVRFYHHHLHFPEGKRDLVVCSCDQFTVMFGLDVQHLALVNRIHFFWNMHTVIYSYSTLEFGVFNYF